MADVSGIPTAFIIRVFNPGLESFWGLLTGAEYLMHTVQDYNFFQEFASFSSSSVEDVTYYEVRSSSE
jgi:hypothetical protein